MSGERSCRSCGRSDGDFPSRGSRWVDCRRAAGRAYYQRHRGYYLAKARARQVIAIDDVRRWLIDYLSAHPCSDCGMDDIRVLEFDHRDGEVKRTAVSVLARGGYSLATVQREIATCVVRCANCHRIRTHEQRGWWGAKLPGG